VRNGSSFSTQPTNHFLSYLQDLTFSLLTSSVNLNCSSLSSLPLLHRSVIFWLSHCFLKSLQIFVTFCLRTVYKLIIIWIQHSHLRISQIKVTLIVISCNISNEPPIYETESCFRMEHVTSLMKHSNFYHHWYLLQQSIEP